MKKICTMLTFLILLQLQAPEMNAKTVKKAVSVFCTIKAIDLEKETVTVRTVKGAILVIKSKKSRLERRKVGDYMKVTYREKSDGSLELLSYTITPTKKKKKK